jgi:hypothetical protein
MWRIFGPVREEVTGDWRELLNYLPSSQDIRLHEQDMLHHLENQGTDRRILKGVLKH